MSTKFVSRGGGNAQFADVHAMGVHADGTVFLDGSISHHESFGHRVKRYIKKAIPWMLLAVVSSEAIHNARAHALPEYLAAATVITNVGQAIPPLRMRGTGTEPSYVAWGTGAGTAAASDTTLFTEASEARTLGTSSSVTTTQTGDTYQVVGLITVAGADKTITNVGLFTASSSGTMYFKSDFSGLPLIIGDSITFTIKVKFS